MSAQALNPLSEFIDYSQRLQAVLQGADWTNVARLAEELRDCWRTGRRVFLCGNGGSAGNAIHLAKRFSLRRFEDFRIGFDGIRLARQFVGVDLSRK
jgi:phosphoheptose isomerase